MINLLPPEEKRQLAAARTNTLLARYSTLLAIIVGLLVLEIVGMYFFVDVGTAQNKAIIEENDAKTAAFSSTKAQSEVFSKNLATAKYILSKQVPYTSLVFTLAGSLPKGSTLDNVALDPATFGTPTTLTVKTTSYSKAIAVKSALQNAKYTDKTPLFSSVNFQSVSSNEDATSEYSHTAIFNVTYSKELLTQ